MRSALLGALLMLVSLLGSWVGWKVAEEYRYYQVIKKEHQEFFLTPIGKTPDGRLFTRKQFFDAMLAQTAKAQQGK